MKKLTTTLILFLIGLASLNAQNQIANLYTVPANPTVNDQVKVVAELIFVSGTCDMDTLMMSINNQQVSASSHHCIGGLTYICNDNDTFDLGMLSAGNYEFVLTLTSGGAPFPCTAGIAIDDMDTLNFSISDPTAIGELAASKFRFYPNPVRNEFELVLDAGYQQAQAKIYGTDGRLMQEEQIVNQLTTISTDLPTGYYLLEVVSPDGNLMGRKKLVVVR